jgi:hypothetical protein
MENKLRRQPFYTAKPILMDGKTKQSPKNRAFLYFSKVRAVKKIYSDKAFLKNNLLLS